MENCEEPCELDDPEYAALFDRDMRIFCIALENPMLDYDQCAELAREEIEEEREFMDKSQPPTEC
jgi:hypothetical protein